MFFKKFLHTLLFMISFSFLFSSPFAVASHKRKAEDEGSSSSKKARLEDEGETSINAASLVEPAVESASTRELLHSDFNQVFYIFGLGQGNSQLAIYKNSRIGILYDCGSTAQTVKDKYIATRQSTQDLFISKLSESAPTGSAAAPPQPPVKRMPVGGVDEPASLATVGRIPSNSSDVSYGGAPITVDETGYIKKIIESYGLKHLFIIASHPDVDHINSIASVIPDGLKVYFILNGDFTSRRLRPAFTALFGKMQKIGAFVFLPYLWRPSERDYPPYFQGKLIDFFRFAEKYAPQNDENRISSSDIKKH